MRVPFTKMQGAGNDFVLLDETAEQFNLSVENFRFLADRRFGIGADQILLVRHLNDEDGDADFEYLIRNADGSEVNQCGNGARCFAWYVYSRGLSDKRSIRVRTKSGIITPRIMSNEWVQVDMGKPIFEMGRVPFLAENTLSGSPELGWQLAGLPATNRIHILSMGNPHAVQVVDDIEQALVQEQGPLLMHHTAFPEGVNAGFMQVVSRTSIRLRVFERGAGETLACGTGACAAVVTGQLLGLLDSRVEVHTRGGVLTIEWNSEIKSGHNLTQASFTSSPVLMTGPAKIVFTGEINL